jgi:hypothetical protein
VVVASTAAWVEQRRACVASALLSAAGASALLWRPSPDLLRLEGIPQCAPPQLFTPGGAASPLAPAWAAAEDEAALPGAAADATAAAAAGSGSGVVLPERVTVFEGGVRYHVALKTYARFARVPCGRGIAACCLMCLLTACVLRAQRPEDGVLLRPAGEPRARARRRARRARPGPLLLLGALTCLISAKRFIATTSNTARAQGGFAISAALGGAAHVTGVDSSASAVALARDNAALNGVSEERCSFVEADCLDFMRAELDAGRAGSYDIVILDPPKLAPSRDALPKAAGRYRRLNQAAAELTAPGGLLVTCTCSGAMTQSGAFAGLVADAAAAAGRGTALLAQAGAAPCHARCVGYPEGEYLTAVFLGVS